MVAFQTLLAEPGYPCWTMTWLSCFPFFFFWADGLTNCWILVFLDGFGPTAKQPWAHHVLPAVPWCCLPTSHLPPHSHLQCTGVSAHPSRTTSLAPFYSAEKGLQRDKAMVFKLIDLHGVTSASTCTANRVRMCSEHHWHTSEELWGDVALLTLLCNLVPSTTSVTRSFSRMRYLPGLKKQWKWELLRSRGVTAAHTWVTFSCQLWCWQQYFCTDRAYLSRTLGEHLAADLLSVTAPLLSVPQPGNFRCTQDGKASHSPPPEVYNSKGVNQNAWNLLVLWTSKCNCWLAGWKGCKQATQPSWKPPVYLHMHQPPCETASG